MKKLQIFFLIAIISSKLFAVTITINGSDGRTTVKSVNNETEKLFLIQENPNIISIEGLENLPALKYIQISFSDLCNMSLSTWESMSKIETLKIDFCTLSDFVFLEYLPRLKVFSFTEGKAIKDSSVIDLHNNEFLEYFEIHINRLPQFPQIINNPKSLKYVIFNFDISNVYNINMDNRINVYVKLEYQYMFNNNDMIDDTEYLLLLEKYQI